MHKNAAPDAVPVPGPHPGTELWATRDYGGGVGEALSLSKASLGNFFHALLRMGGSIQSTHCLNHKYDRSYVQAMVVIPAGKRAELEAETGIGLERPSYLKPASGGFSF
jgi:hypothetical protein